VEEIFAAAEKASVTMTFSALAGPRLVTEIV
jgi:hypothetical protein